MSHVQLLQADHLSNCLRQRSRELIEANIQHSQVSEKADVGIDATCEPIVEEDNLIERRAKVTDAGGKAASEMVIGKD